MSRGSQVGSCLMVLAMNVRAGLVSDSWKRARISASVPVLQGGIGYVRRDRGQRAQEHGHRHRAFAVEADDQIIALAGLELHPGAAVRDQLGRSQQPAGGAVFLGFEIHARRADELRDHHPFAAVDDERALFRHQRHVAEEDILLDGFGDFRPDQQHRNIQRRGISDVPLEAVFDGVLGFFEPEFKAPLLRFRAVARGSTGACLC